jgi:hypothetical protein
LSIQLGGDVADQCGQVPAGGVSVGAAQKYGLELRSFIAAHDRKSEPQLGERDRFKLKR